MTESQAKEILAFAKSFAGLSDEQPSVDSYQLFLLYAVRPIIASPDYQSVLKKYFVDNAEDLLGKLLELQAQEKLNLAEIFEKAILKKKCVSAVGSKELIARVSDLTKYLKTAFLWKFTEMEKSLRTQLRDALGHKDFDHSGIKGSKVDTRNYWPVGKLEWETFNGNLDPIIKREGIDYPPANIPAFPEDGTQLPYPKDIIIALHQIFHAIQKKVWFNSFLLWLDSDDSPYRSKSLNEEFDKEQKGAGERSSNLDPGEPEEMETSETDIEAPSEPNYLDGPSAGQLIDRAEEILSGLKPQYQESFKTAFIWYKDHWKASSLGIKELEIITGKKSSTLHEHIKKIENPLVIKPLMEKCPGRSDLLRKVFEHFRKTYSEHNPEKKRPDLFKEIKGS